MFGRERERKKKGQTKMNKNGFIYTKKNTKLLFWEYNPFLMPTEFKINVFGKYCLLHNILCVSLTIYKHGMKIISWSMQKHLNAENNDFNFFKKNFGIKKPILIH